MNPCVRPGEQANYLSEVISVCSVSSAVKRGGYIHQYSLPASFSYNENVNLAHQMDNSVTSTQRQGVILIVLAAAGYAMLPIFAKWAYAAGLEPLDVVTWRFLFATPVIWLLARRFGSAGDAAKLPRVKLLLMGGVFGIAAMLAFFSLDRIPASTYIVLAYLYPAFVAVFSMFNGEYLSSLGWSALVITIIGVALTVPDFMTGFENSDPIGMLLGVLNGFGYSIYIVLSNRLLRGQTALGHASALSITGSLIVLLIVALGITGLNVPPDFQTWMVIVGVALTSSVLPIFAFYAGMQRLGAPQAAILSTIEPILVVLLSTLLLGERMLPIQIVGGALILLGAVLLQVKNLRPAAQTEPAAPVQEQLQGVRAES